MAINIESALAGKHGKAAQLAAEAAVLDAVEAVAKTLKPLSDGAFFASGVPIVGYATGGIFKPGAQAIIGLGGPECIMPRRPA